MKGKIVQVSADRGFFFLRHELTPSVTTAQTQPPRFAPMRPPKVSASATRFVDYFAHREDLPAGVDLESLKVGDEWEFEGVRQGMKGPRVVPGSLRRPNGLTLDELITRELSK